MSHLNRPPDALDRATDELRRAPVPPGPPAELAAATIAATNRLAGPVPAGPDRRQRRRTVMRYIGYGTATAAAVTLAVAAGVLWLTGPSAEAAVRRALDNAGRAKSVRLVFTREYEGKSEPMMTVHIRDGQSRWEGRKKDEQFTMLVDLRARQVLKLNHADKTATREALAGDLLADARKQHEVFFNPLDVLRGTRDMTVKELDGEKLSGRPTKVFMVSHPGNQEHAAMTGVLWIDAKTDLPARLKLLEDGVVTDGREPPWPKADTVIAFEDWNKEFDAKLFRRDIPEGYREEKPR